MHIVYLSYRSPQQGSLPSLRLINSSWSTNAIWRHRLAHAMACCLTKPNHYLNRRQGMVSGLQPTNAKSYISQHPNPGSKPACEDWKHTCVWLINKMRLILGMLVVVVVVVVVLGKGGLMYIYIYIYIILVDNDRCWERVTNFIPSVGSNSVRNYKTIFIYTSFIYDI